MSFELARRLVADAKVSNAEFAQRERTSGMGVIEETTSEILLRTAMSAIFCGIGTGDMAAIAAGYVMLADLHLLLTGSEYIQ